jgi:hypothetical protein
MRSEPGVFALQTQGRMLVGQALLAGSLVTMGNYAIL